MCAQIKPTRMELTRLKSRLQTAERGHKLLKDKRDEMVRRFMIYIKKNRTLREEIEIRLTEALQRFSVAESRMGEDLVTEALLCPAKSTDITVDKANIMSVDVPKLKYEESGKAPQLPYGFSFTSGELDQSVLDISELMPLLIELAEVEKTCNLLADEIEKTRRRVNALEHVMIPETKKNIKYIMMRLEENERGTTTRLMKVKDMMLKDG